MDKERQEVAIPEDLQKELAKLKGVFGDKDMDGYLEPPSIPFAQIAQRNKITGLIKFNDERAPVKALNLLILFSHPCRTWFRSVGEMTPTCKSIDAITSMDGKDCLTCEHAVWRENKSPECKEGRHLLVIDTDAKDKTPFMISFSPSGIKPFKRYFQMMARQKVALFAVVTNLTSQEESLPKPHYIPVLEIKKVLSKKEIDEVKKVRDKIAKDYQIIRRTIVIPEEPEEELPKENIISMEKELKSLMASLTLSEIGDVTLIVKDKGIAEGLKKARELTEDVPY